MTLWSVRGRTLALGAGAALLAIVAGSADGDWRTASREPVGLAPDPATTPEAVVQAYGARALRWRGYFGVHTWIAVKPAGAPAYTVYEVIDWRLRWSDTALVVHQRAPDGRWLGNEPELLAERRGEGVDAMIDRIARAEWQRGAAVPRAHLRGQPLPALAHAADGRAPGRTPPQRRQGSRRSRGPLTVAIVCRTRS